MSTGFTTTATISELIDKRPIKRKKRSNRSRKAVKKSSYRATQRLLRV
tara:strand:- start:2760 stop:2903 length:144 start_codon:yes stop_codon:yes gene_type:complete